MQTSIEKLTPQKLYVLMRPAVDLPPKVEQILRNNGVTETYLHDNNDRLAIDLKKTIPDENGVWDGVGYIKIHNPKNFSNLIREELEGGMQEGKEYKIKNRFFNHKFKLFDIGTLYIQDGQYIVRTTDVEPRLIAIDPTSGEFKGVQDNWLKRIVEKENEQKQLPIKWEITDDGRTHTFDGESDLRISGVVDFQRAEDTFFYITQQGGEVELKYIQVKGRNPNDRTKIQDSPLEKGQRYVSSCIVGAIYIINYEEIQSRNAFLNKAVVKSLMYDIHTGKLIQGYNYEGTGELVKSKVVVVDDYNRDRNERYIQNRESGQRFSVATTESREEYAQAIVTGAYLDLQKEMGELFKLRDYRKEFDYLTQKMKELGIGLTNDRNNTTISENISQYCILLAQFSNVYTDRQDSLKIQRAGPSTADTKKEVEESTQAFDIKKKNLQELLYQIRKDGEQRKSVDQQLAKLKEKYPDPVKELSAFFEDYVEEF